MDPRKHLILAKGKIVTSNVVFCRYNRESHKVDIKFANGKVFSYLYENVTWLKPPVVLNPKDYRISYNGTELFGITEIYLFKNSKCKYWHICFQNGSERDFKDEGIEATVSCLEEKASKNVFSYLKEIAAYVGPLAEDGTQLLSKQYEKLTFVAPEMAFATYLNPDRKPVRQLQNVVPFFPFGCNASQYTAVKNALCNQISVIQGPPGTGKTQTILNILANLLVAGMTVQVVSNNNSATENILEKLSIPKYELDFLVAPLGNSLNKKRFICEQKNQYPEIIESWGSIESNSTEFYKEVQNRSQELNSLFEEQERLALITQDLQELSVEQEHFKRYQRDSGRVSDTIHRGKRVTSVKLLDLMRQGQKIAEKASKPSLLFKLKCCLFYGIADWNFYSNDFMSILTLLQFLYYDMKHKELTHEIESLRTVLAKRNLKQLAEEVSEMSIQFLKAHLYKVYGNRKDRRVFSDEDLWKNHKEVQKEYPIILSTTFSARSSLCKEAEFDFIIIDEASQVDVATGALAMSCAKNAIIVGDEKQLPNVVTAREKSHLQNVFNAYTISANYNFAELSFLQSICNIVPDAPQTLLREHYRCHPKIINFCNQEFYAGNLVIMSEDRGEGNVIIAVKTVIGNHMREHMNQRQIDVIKDEILPALQYQDEEIGIIAPYNNQVDAIRRTLVGRKIDIATVHKFQGREKEAIIITTVDDVVTDFSDDPNLLNVAVSRARKSLHLVVSGNNQPRRSNIGDLIDYIEYNNFTVIESAIYSVFDFLYCQYTIRRLNYLKSRNKVSEFDSENLVYALITDVLHEKDYSSLAIAAHHPLYMLIRDQSRMTQEEKSYAMNSATHLDFLIYNRINKKPFLAIEVDGFKYHKRGTVQALRDKKKDHILELYGIPLLRFATNGSREKERLILKMDELLNTEWKIPPIGNCEIAAEKW